MFKKLSTLLFVFFATVAFPLSASASTTGASDVPALPATHVDVGGAECSTCHAEDMSLLVTEVDAVVPAVVVTSPPDTDGGDTDGVPVSDADILEKGKDAVSLFRSGEWALAISAAMMVLIALARRFHLLDRVPSKAVPWVSAVLGVALVVADSFSTGGALTLERVLTGLLAGMAASGMWSLVGKHIPFMSLPAKEEEKA